MDEQLRTEEISKNPNMVNYFILYVNTLLDSNDHRDKLTFEKAKTEVENENIIEFLRNEFEGDVDFSTFKGEVEASFNRTMAEIAGRISGRERRKVGVENNGLCLLIAYANDLLAEIHRD